MFNPVAVCADIGSVAKGRFGWWASTEDQGAAPSSLVRFVSGQLESGRPVALGFECPLYIPVADDECELTAARIGEGSRPWSAGAGCGSLVTGLAETTWVLRGLAERASSCRDCYVNWDDFARRGTGLFLWEAFVTGSAKGGDHVEDARRAVAAFLAALPDPTMNNALTPSPSVLSLIGLALLRSGWSRDLSLLETPCLVIRAS